MEQGTSLKPNRISFNRVTAAGTFYADDSTGGGVSLGVVHMTALDEGIQREKVMFPINGAVTLGYEEAVSVSPVYTIKGRQMHDAILPLIYMGTRNADVVQSSGTGINFTITGVALGMAYDIGARDVTLNSVKVGAAFKTLDVDFYFDPRRGEIRFPNIAAGIAAGDNVVVNFERPARTRTSVTAYNKLNQTGTLKLFNFDSATLPVEEAALAGSISRDKGSDGDPTKTNEWALRFAIIGTPTFLRRQTNA